MFELSRKIQDVAKMAIPDPEDSWERGNADMKTIQTKDGHNIEVPVFDSSIDTVSYVGCESVEQEDGSELKIHHYEVVTESGYMRHVKVLLPSPVELDEAECTIHMDTPYFTGEKGHNERVAAHLTYNTKQPTVLVGPEEIPEHSSGLYIVKNLAKVATDTSSISLAQTAADSVAILDAMMELHPELPRDVIVVGESRAAMLAPAKHEAAKKLGINNKYYDITDPCQPEHVFTSVKHVINLARFLPTELIHAAPVGADMLVHGSLKKERKTVPMRAQYFGAAVLGTAPALLNGEAGRLPYMLPDDIPVHLASFKSNPIAYHEKWREMYADSLFAGVNLHGAHLGLAYSSVLEHLEVRIKRYVYERKVSGKDEYIDYRRVHLKDDKKYLGPNEHMLDVAAA